VDRLAVIAQEHYRRYLPKAYASLAATQRAAFFQDLSDQMQEQIDGLAEAIAGEDPPQESFQAKVGRLSEARSSAEAAVLREMLPPPEAPPTPDPSGELEATDTPPPDPQDPGWTPVYRAIEDFWSAAAGTEERGTAPTP